MLDANESGVGLRINVVSEEIASAEISARKRLVSSRSNKETDVKE